MPVASLITGIGRRLNLRVITLAILTVVVLVLAVLQYYWIAELSDAHEAQAASRLRGTVTALANAIDTEVTRPALIFGTPLRSGPVSFEIIEGRWKTWMAAARWPRIVSGVALVATSDTGQHTQWLGSPAITDIGPLVRDIVPRRLMLFSGRGRVYGRGSLEHIVDREPAFVLPLPVVSDPPGPRPPVVVLIRFDGNYLAGTVLSQLLEPHATPDDRQDFRFELRPRTSAKVSDAIAAVDVFRFRPDCLRPVRGPGIIEPPPDVMSVLQLNGDCQVPRGEGAGGLMQLVVQSRERPMNALFARFRWRNQMVSGLVLAMLIVTTAVLVVSAERARKLGRIQTMVAAGISHELRTPLASLRLAADDLKSGLIGNVEQARRYGEVIEAQSRRLGHVVDQALALASAASGSPGLQLRPVSVIEIFDMAIAVVSRLTPAAPIVVDTGPHLRALRIMADPELVVRCLTNLIENAMKYAPAGGYIYLSAQPARRSGKSFVEITVEDRGPGIEDGEAADVFEPFYRGSSARRSRQPGSGLGLAVVRTTVEAHGGAIALEHANPHGCRMRLFFPAAEPARNEG
jgi:signal transduction histidine kinase